MPRSSSSRRSNKWQRERRELSTGFATRRRVDDASDGQWIVQEVSGNGSGKTYTCPGCNQTLTASVPHTVAWREEAGYGISIGPGARRHWHTSCFRSRRR
ncbi:MULTISPECIES: hypothetical protein [Brevibacterium]|jgi:hypothetical protein|uniref:ATP/GTP-binding protein n=1 Tax=Brevibacterium salitolerans TaxID=1403566 RepID=A0ABN2WBQ9_9MICO|nr:hypothetical protein [Brevibacterium sp.]